MKRIILASTLLSALCLSACGDSDVLSVEIHTKKFYYDNIEKAKEVVEKCHKLDREAEQLEKKSRKDANRVLYGKVRNYRANCDHAQDAVEAYDEFKEKSTRLKEASTYIEEQKKKFADLTWQQKIEKNLEKGGRSYKYLGYVLSDKDIFTYFLSDNYIFGSNWMDYLEEKVKSFIYYIAKREGINEMLKVDYPTLVNDKSYCATDRRKYSVCSVWKEAVEQKSKLIIEEFMDNYDQLKATFNQCLDGGDFNNYPCYQAGQAVGYLKLPTNQKLED